VELQGEEANQAFHPAQADFPTALRMMQADIERVQEFRKCIECFLCQDVCHVLRDHHKHAEFSGPRFFIYNAQLEMHPLDTADRLDDLRGPGRHRLLQHHQVLHQGLSRRTSRSPDNGIIRSRSASSTGSTIGHAPVPRPDWRRQVTSTLTVKMKTLPRSTIPAALTRRALSPAERARGGGEHLPRHPRRRPTHEAALVNFLLALTDRSRGAACATPRGAGATGRAL